MVRTRFAPSPTGYLHIGGVRTAFFNWLFARKHGGQFILRIDDTDQQRNVAESLAPILHGFKWLGLNWDEGAEIGGPHGPYYQSQKLERYQDAVRQLVESGHAYWDYASAEEMKAEMDAAEREKRPKIYSRKWMAQTNDDRARFEAQGRKGSVRLKMPREGACQFTDLIRGKVSVEWSSEQDIVVQRSDGSITYNLASVIDDYDMRITHVIRAEEHLSNTPRQIFAARGLGYELPQYAHVPFVAEPGSKNKLSKRKIAQYLKNPDFKKIYDHGVQVSNQICGLEVALKAKQTFHEWREKDPSLTQATYEKFLPGMTFMLSRFTQGLGAQPGAASQEEAAKIVRRLAEEYWADPALLATYEHGRGIFSRFGMSLPAETFNPVVIDFYERVGYLPDAILNYLMLLGWAHEDGKTEFFTRQEMIDLFSLERVNKGSASFDAKKLFAFQEHYMTALPTEEKVKLCLPYLQRAGLVGESLSAAEQETLNQVIAHAGPRLVVAGDILNFDDFFLPDDQIRYDEKAFEKHVKKSPDLLKKLRDVLVAIEPFDAGTLKKKVEEIAVAEGSKIGPVSQLLRVAVTGKETGFGTFETLAVVGKERCLKRVERALGML